MSKFIGIFKSFDNIKTATQPIVKVDAPAPSLPSPVHRHFQSQHLAKRLRGESTTGFWKAVRDARYDDLVVSSLMKCGANEAQAEDFMKSEAGYQLGATLHSTATKCLGVSTRVKKSFDDWQAKWTDVLERAAPVRKTVGELGSVSKAKDALGHGSNAHSEMAADFKSGKTKFNPDHAIIQSALKAPIHDIGQLSLEEKYHLDHAANLGMLQKGKGGPYPVLKRTWAAPNVDIGATRESDIDGILHDPPGKNSREPVLKKSDTESIADFIAKEGNPNHDEKGRFASGQGAAMRSEGKGAVSDAKEYTDKAGVARVKLRSTGTGSEVNLDMRKDVMEDIRSGKLTTNANLAPEKWGAGGENAKRDEFDAVNGYRPAAEIAAKYGKDSDVARLNEDLGQSAAKAWARIEQASNFAPGEAMHSALLYKADQILQNAAVNIVPQMKLAMEHDGVIPVPILNPPQGVTHEEHFANAKKSYANEMNSTIGGQDATTRYNFTPCYSATREEPGAGPEIDHKSFLTGGGSPPFEIDIDKVPGGRKKLEEQIAEQHDRP